MGEHAKAAGEVAMGVDVCVLNARENGLYDFMKALESNALVRPMEA